MVTIAGVEIKIRPDLKTKDRQKMHGKEVSVTVFKRGTAYLHNQPYHPLNKTGTDNSVSITNDPIFFFCYTYIFMFEGDT